MDIEPFLNALRERAQGDDGGNADPTLEKIVQCLSEIHTDLEIAREDLDSAQREIESHEDRLQELEN